MIIFVYIHLLDVRDMNELLGVPPSENFQCHSSTVATPAENDGSQPLALTQNNLAATHPSTTTSHPTIRKG